MVLVDFLPDTPLVNVFVVLVATAFIWVGSGWLETSAEELSEHYGLPPVVQGSIVVAVGSSFPELASVVFTALNDVFDMGVGAIVGSAIFNILVIPALAGLAVSDDLDTNRTIVYKEAQFYMIAVSALVVTFALAVIYNPVSGATDVDLLGELTRPLAAIPLALYGLYLFIQWQDVNDHEAAESTVERVGRSWLLLAAGLALILLAVETLVGSVESLSQTFGIPEFLAGVTIVAAATSLPDLLVSVRSARVGKGVTSLGNVLGSNTFDLLVAIPLGVLIVGTVTINFAVAVPMFGVLTLATVLLFTFLRTDLSLTSLESALLLVAYLAFVAWVVAETLGFSGLIKTV
ncbi:cation:H+ antiporter [Halogranum rubrum]|uniref:Cation:H+ antiporter n=1 Tax=Halogranum rubrum TaxID=553466 RepID=A0A1I4BP54_9EURY|nr:sodium:calcium antiporter [Halogranum rubrum]SFK69641.1 cation:H+ antiporter [Halogranum rubrum]